MKANSIATLLSTKKLSLAQKELLLNSGISFVEYDAIQIELLSFNTPNFVKNAIFSSKNAVKSVKKHKNELFSGNIENCYCVGSKTKALLEENNQKVVKMSKNASELGDFIAKYGKNEVFYFFSGTLRRDEIPSALKKAKIEHFEIKTYQTELKKVKIDRKFDGILFFSPSGVQSYVSENKIGNSLAFCMGETTASEARKHTENVIISNSTSVESVIAKAVKTLKEI